MYFKCIDEGMFDSNCYLLAEDGVGVLIDCGVDNRKINSILKENNITLKYIIITHAHYDHICCANELSSDTGAGILVHEDDLEAIKSPTLNLSTVFGMNYSVTNIVQVLKDDDIIRVGDMEFRIINTPGHTPGGICILHENRIFTGDTLFKLLVGRTDLYNGNYIDLIRAIKDKLMVLDDDIAVYPGHGESSTIGFEKKNNPYLK